MELFLATLDQFFDYGRYTLEFFLMAFVFSNTFRKKDHFRRRVIILAASALLVSVLCSFLAALYISKTDMTAYSKISWIFFALLGIPSILLALTGYEESIGTRLSVLLSTVAIRNGTRSIYQIIYSSVGVAQNNPDFYQLGNQQKIYLFFYYFFLIIVSALFAYFLHKAYKNPYFKGINVRILFVFIFYFLMNIGISLVENALRKTSAIYFLVILSCSALLSMLVVFIQFLFLFLSYKDSEKEILENTYRARMREYDMIQENIDLINLKCHDLRHQMRAAQLSGNLDAKFVEDVTNSINIYDNNVKTGNRDLDLLLMDFKFRAQAAKAEFPIIADGEAVSFMERQDIISLFSNMIENALDYEKNLVDDKEKFISLNISQKNGFLVIVCENNLGEQKKPEKPKDNRFHGFGTLSIRQITRKYEGAYSLSTDKGVYKVNITIPIPEKKEQ